MINNKKVLITGASKGIGRAVAEALVKKGYKVIGTSRNPDKIIHKISHIEYIKLDLSDERSIEECIEKVEKVDVLINNGGESQIGAAEEIPIEKIKKIFQTNLFGSIRLIQGFLPWMREKGDGYIINIGSMAGKFAIPFQSSYSSSKFALGGYSWALRNEVMKYGIKVVVIEPNDINTTIKPEIFLNEESSYKNLIAAFKSKRDINISKGSHPDVVARKIIRILKMKNPRPFYTVGGLGPLLVFIKRLLPDKIMEKLIKKNYKIN